MNPIEQIIKESISRAMCLALIAGGAFGNVDGSGRQIQIIVHTEGVHVRAGYFFGTVEEFAAKALDEGKPVYARVIPAVANELLTHVEESGETGGWEINQ